MSKQFYLGVIIFCCILIFLGSFFYWKKFSSVNEKRVYRDTILSPTIQKPEYPKRNTSSEKNIEKEKDIVAEVSLLALGDIMLDRSVMLKTQAVGDYNHPFVLIDPLFQKYNVRFANLEGPITTNKSVANGTGGARFTFTFSPKFVDPLKNRFELLSLANNHTHNFGQIGLDQTRKFLDEAGIQYFGDPSNSKEFLSVTSSYHGITFGFIGYHQLVEKGFENILAEIKHLDSEVDILIALPHWGIEYVTNTVSFLQKKEGHEMIDAGVDIIIGSHPHVVEPIEIYKEKVIFYSLGNFIFDQYFSEDTLTGLGVGMKIEKQMREKYNITYTFIPLDINKQSQVSVAESQKKEKVLKHISKFSILPSSFREKIEKGEFSLVLP